METYEYTKDELQNIHNFIDEIGNCIVSIKIDEETKEEVGSYFGRCDICDLLSDVIDIEVSYIK